MIVDIDTAVERARARDVDALCVEPADPVPLSKFITELTPDRFTADVPEMAVCYLPNEQEFQKDLSDCADQRENYPTECSALFVSCACRIVLQMLESAETYQENVT